MNIPRSGPDCGSVFIVVDCLFIPTVVIKERIVLFIHFLFPSHSCTLVSFFLSFHYISYPPPPAFPFSFLMKPDYLTPLTAEQRKDVSQLIMFTEANRRPLRKPRIRKRDPKTPPRPANCFLVYRREKQSQIAELCKGANHRVISKLVAKWWKEMDSVTKTIYVDVANQLKQEHTVK